MIDVDFHAYTDNRTLSSAWTIQLPAVPRVGESIEYNPTYTDTPLWIVTEVGYHVPEGTREGRAFVFCRPSWAPEVGGDGPLPS